jgi:hypothetical protein
VSDWRTALDRYEAALDAHEQALDAGEPPLGDLWPPAALPSGAMPAPQRERAVGLLARTHLLTARTQQALDRLPRPAPARSMAPHAPLTPQASLLDARM